MYCAKLPTICTLFMMLACCGFLLAQEASPEPIIKQSEERTIIGSNQSNLTKTTQLGSGFNLVLGAGTRSFETVEQSIARTHALVTQPNDASSALVTHGALFLELSKTFNLNSRLDLTFYGGIEGRMPITTAGENQGMHSNAAILPYAGARLEYQTQNAGTYDASVQFNGSSVLSSGSATPASQPAMATPSLSPISVGLGWISGKKKKDNIP
jgi:hypothetical protein